ncbi:MAG: hypothetical protein QE263_03500 [Vampirovibrionales bacterium]|nr:hypothetical protein [Vampirovibrionales bacterium]
MRDPLLTRFENFSDSLIAKTNSGNKLSQADAAKLVQENFNAAEVENLLGSVYGLKDKAADWDGNGVINFLDLASRIGYGNEVDHREALAAQDRVLEAQIKLMNPSQIEVLAEKKKALDAINKALDAEIKLIDPPEIQDQKLPNNGPFNNGQAGNQLIAPPLKSSKLEGLPVVLRNAFLTPEKPVDTKH